MKPKVHQLAHSPYCIPVTQALTACGVAHETVEVPYSDRSELLRLTKGAYYQVPVLEHDGKFIYEADGTGTEIARYLDKTFAKGRLFPDEHEGLQRILIPHIENEVETATFKLVDPAYIAAIPDVAQRGMAIRHKERKFGRGCVEQWKADRKALQKAAEQLLLPFELILSHHLYLLGNKPVFADFALYGIFGNLTFKGYNTVPSALRSTQDWFSRMESFRFS